MTRIGSPLAENMLRLKCRGMCPISDKIYCFPDNLPRVPALSADSLSLVTCRDIDTGAIWAYFAFQCLSFQLCTKLCYLISTFLKRKERTQRQRSRTPCISICLGQGTKPYHNHDIRTQVVIRRIRGVRERLPKTSRDKLA